MYRGFTPGPLPRQHAASKTLQLQLHCWDRNPSYLALVNAFDHDPSKDPRFPLLFPVQYALAMQKGNTDRPVAETTYTTDLIRIAKDLSRPILLLIDEASVLANSKLQLQLIRNLFMTLHNYMLIMAGLPDP